MPSTADKTIRSCKRPRFFTGSILLALPAVFFIAGCAPTSKYINKTAIIRGIVVAPPVIDLEVFPNGVALQTPAEDRRMQAELGKMAEAKLGGKFNVDPAPDLSPAAMDDIANDLQKMFLDLKETGDIAQVKTNKQIKEFLNRHFGKGDVFIASYRGYQRTKKSLASGYQSSAFITELATGIDPVDNDDKFLIKPQYYPSAYTTLPDEYGATLTVLLLAGPDKEPVYFNTVHRAQNPQDEKLMDSMLRQALKPITKLE